MQNQQYLPRRKLLIGGLAAVAYNLFSASGVSAEHERLGKLSLSKEQVASLGSNPIERLRHEILYRYLTHQSQDDYCMASEMHGKRNTKRQSRDACDERWPSRDVIYANTDHGREDFIDGVLIVKAVPTGEIETTLDGKVRRLKMSPNEPFPFALDILYNPDSSQSWIIHEAGVKGDIEFDPDNPVGSDRITAALVSGTSLKYFLPREQGYKIGKLGFEGSGPIRVYSFDERRLRVSLDPGSPERIFEFPVGVSKSYSKRQSEVRATKIMGNVYYFTDDSYESASLQKAKKTKGKAKEFGDKASAITKAVYAHLIKNLTQRGYI